MRPLFQTAVVLGFATVPVGHAMACSALSDDRLIQLSNIVVDGTATCDVSRGACVLRADGVIKDDTWPRDERRRLFHFRFEPGANARMEREMQQQAAAGSDFIIACLWPWEPQTPRIEGRFYLRREHGRLVPRQDSARGEPKPEEEPKDE